MVLAHILFWCLLIVLSLLSNHLAALIKPGMTQDESFRSPHLLICLGCAIAWALAIFPLRWASAFLLGYQFPLLLLCYYQILSTTLNTMPFTIFLNHSTFTEFFWFTECTREKRPREAGQVVVRPNRTQISSLQGQGLFQHILQCLPNSLSTSSYSFLNIGLLVLFIQPLQKGLLLLGFTQLVRQNIS